MQSTLMNAKDWAAAEFANAQLGDRRRKKRLLKVAAVLAEKPKGTLPKSFDRWADLKAAYRLFSSQEVNYQKIITPHWQQSRQACQEPGEYLLIEDTTALDFTSHQAAKDLGLIGDGRGRGILVHSNLAVRIERWNSQQEPQTTIVGLFGQHCWARQASASRKTEKKSQRLRRQRESQRWAAVFEESGGPGAQSRWTYVADRESDIYEVFGRCGKHGVNFIIRASQPRALAQEDRSVFQAVSERPLLGRFSISLRARPGQAARKAVIELRSTVVTLRAPWRPGAAKKPLEVSVVEAREVNAPAGVKAIHWVLLSNWPCANFEEAKAVVKAYSRRWLIEEYHKALKSGLHVEQSQLSRLGSIEALLGILAVMGVRLLNTKLLAGTCPDQPLESGEFGPEALAILESLWGQPSGGWTYGSVLIAIARMGGFLARRGDGQPGWLTIWRGWQELMLMVQGYTLAKGERCG